MTAPEPLVPAECSMVGNDWFPLYFDRLRKSRWWRRATDLARARNVMLWGEAYKNVPAGSMPDDDDDLAEAAGFGMDVEGFLAAKADIMAPWTMCSDGRWYHPTICEVVLEAWERTSDKKKKAAEKKAAQRARVRGQPSPKPPVPPSGADVPNENANVPGDTDENEGDIRTHNRTGQDRQDRTPPPPNGGEQAGLGLEDDQPTGRRKPKRAIPEGFPDAAAISEQQLKARAAGANIDVAYQADRFRNWSIGKDARYADWLSTWRNWMAKAIADAPKSITAGSAPVDAPWRLRVREFAANRYWNALEWGPAPGKDGCRVSPEIQREFGIEPAKPQPVGRVA